MNLHDAILRVEKAVDMKSLFGTADPSKVYKELAKLLHPDKTKGNLRAQEAFIKLGKLYESLNGKSPATVIGKWTVGAAIAKGDIADLYECEHLDGKQKGVFKIARSEADTDLMEEESFALKYLLKNMKSSNFAKYIPRVLDTLEASGRRANVISKAEDCYTLADIASFYPEGIPFRHIVWQGNRALNALGAAHKEGILHGAVLPEHLMYRPHDHGLILVDWCYAVTAESKKHVPAMARDRKKFYPPEVERKAAPGPGTDIYMLMRSLMWAAAEKVPKRFKALFDHCLAGSVRSRPEKAWELIERWKETAEAEYGPPAWVDLKIPVS